MKSFVLTYLGAPSLRGPEEARLRARFPLLKLFRRTSTVLEAQYEDGQMDIGSDLGSSWRVSPMSFAEVDAPRINLSTLRQRLSEMGR